MKTKNYNNSDKSIYISAEAIELDNYKTFGYKTNKTGVSFGTNFEFLNDFYLGMGSSNFYEKINTNSTASDRQKDQEGNYWDSFLKLDFDYDKRNQKFQTTQGFRNYFSSDIPLISETNTLVNTYIVTNYYEYLNNSVLKSSFYFQNSNSITGENIKLSERLYLPSNRLRGFQKGKVGPKDGDDFIGGNYIASFNISSDLPKVLENSQTTDLKIF